MPKSFFYSINLLIKSDSHLQKAIASVIADESYFLENVQLILIDTVCSEQSIEICSEYNKKYPDNIWFVDAQGKSEAASYNDARGLCFGKYITYIDNYGEYSKKTLSSLQSKLLKNAKIPVLCVQPIISPSGGDERPYTDITGTGIIKLKEEPDRFILMLGCYFFNKKTADMFSFDESLVFHSDVKFITETLVQTYSYLFTDEHRYTTQLATEREPFRYLPQYSRDFYSRSLKELIVPMMINYPGSVLAQSVMLYMICLRFALNENEKYKHVIIGSFVDEFLDKVSELLRYIEDPVILNRSIYRHCCLDEEMSFRMLRLKYREPELEPEIDLVMPRERVEKSYYNSCAMLVKTTLSGELRAHYKNALIGSSREITADIRVINYDKEGIYVDAVLNGCSFIESKEIQVFVNINGERFSVIPSQVYTLKKYFDIPFLRRFAFSFCIPVSSDKTMDTAFLILKYKKLSFRIGMTFGGAFSKLSTGIRSSYWSFLDRVLMYDGKNQSLVIRRATSSLLRICENKFMQEAGEHVSLTETVHYRQMRRNVRSAAEEGAGPRRILFYDESGINGNGNILFRYFSKHCDKNTAEVWFSAVKGSDAFAYLTSEQYDNVVETGSRKAKQLALSSDIIIAPDCDVYESLCFSKTDLLFLKDLINSSVVSVKNFFITYASAQFENRLRDNTRLFLCASEREREQLLKGAYDYDEGSVRVTGYPLLDTLTDAREKLILIAPGDRRMFCIYENSEYYRFSESRFFRLYNDILIDAPLHEALRSSGYRIALLLPFQIEKYLRLFHSDELVTLYQGTEENEAELVKKASLLITDTSELQYRFAYLNKPVVYYFPHELPVAQELKNEGLSKSCFGRAFFDHEHLIAHLIKEMEQAFPQPDTYSAMCSEFFRYRDNGNCRRLYEEIMKTE